MTRTLALAFVVAAGLHLGACGKPEHGEDHSHDAASTSAGQHAHADGSTHDDHAQGADDHEEIPLGEIMIGGMRVELAEGHGAIAPGKEGHLIVKLPYNDNGVTVVRAWIGTEDRTLSFVGLGEYAASHDDYDIHAIAPDPLPTDARWWVEIERPDGTKAVGSAEPVVR